MRFWGDKEEASSLINTLWSWILAFQLLANERSHSTCRLACIIASEISDPSKRTILSEAKHLIEATDLV